MWNIFHKALAIAHHFATETHTTNFRQKWVLVYLYTETLVITKVQVQFVEFYFAHQVQHFFDSFHTKKVTANVQVKSAVGKLGVVLHVVVNCGKCFVGRKQIEQLAQRLHCVEATGFVACGNCQTSLGNIDFVAFQWSAFFQNEVDLVFLHVVAKLQNKSVATLHLGNKLVGDILKIGMTKYCGLRVNGKLTGKSFRLLRTR